MPTIIAAETPEQQISRLQAALTQARQAHDTASTQALIGKLRDLGVDAADLSEPLSTEAPREQKLLHLIAEAETVNDAASAEALRRQLAELKAHTGEIVTAIDVDPHAGAGIDDLLAGESVRETLNQSEAVYAFLIWLSSRPEPIGPFCDKYDVTEATALADLFCKANHLPAPRPGWGNRMVVPVEIAKSGEQDSDDREAQRDSATEQPDDDATATVGPTGDKLELTPAALKFADEHDIDPAQINWDPGTTRITKPMLEDWLKARQQ